MLGEEGKHIDRLIDICDAAAPLSNRQSDGLSLGIID